MAKIEAVILSVGVTEGSSVWAFLKKNLTLFLRRKKMRLIKRPQRYFSIAAQIMS